MKIAVVGCGAVGSFYGAKLWRVHTDVHFLLRSDYEAVAQHGVWIESPLGSFRARPHLARQPREIGSCDLVIIALKTTANALFPALLPPLVRPETLLLTLQNGLGNEDRLAQLFGPGNILGGLCFLCSNRVRPGQIQHLAFGNISLGEYHRPPQTRTHQLAQLFQEAEIPCDVVPNLERSHWEKLLWNIPFNGLCVASCAGLDAVRSGQLAARTEWGPCLTTDRLLASTHWRVVVKTLMTEVRQIALSLGYQINGSLMDDLIERTLRMGAYKPSTLIDFEAGRALEIDSLFNEPLRQGIRHQFAAPQLAALCSILQQLDNRKVHR